MAKKLISGKHAYVNNVPCTVNWQVSASAAIERYAASCTGGATATTEGNENWTGSASGIGYSPALMPSDSNFTFKGVSDNSVGDALAYSGNVLVTQTQIQIPVARGGPIRWTSQFGVQGVLTEGTVGAADATHVMAPSAKRGKIFIASDLADLADPTEIAKIQNITLTFNRPESTYIDDGATHRFPGNLECDISFEVLERSLVEALYALNALGIVRVIVNEDNDYWELGAVRFGEKSNYVVDASTRAPVGYTVNGMWNSLVPSDFNDDLTGWIQAPDESYFFGAEPTTP